jgi:type III secretion system PrgH/EprH family protein
VLLLLGVGAAALWSHFNRDDGMLQSENLARVLQDPNHRFQIRQGRDQVFYVLASSEPDAAWARQTLSRARLPLNLRVLSRAEEQQRIERWLETQGVNYFVLTLNQLQRPELLLSLERGALDSAAAQSLQQKMLLNMPYAESLAFSWLSDAMVLEQAQARLDRLALVYRRQGDPAQGLVFVLGGDIADGVLSQLRTQLNEFERAYGRHYVRFVLNLREDWLQGKSFKYGADGYVQQSPTHWYFPQPL